MTMNRQRSIVLPEQAVPAKLKLNRPLTEEQYSKFRAANRHLRLRRTKAGEIIIVGPARGLVGQLGKLRAG
jgi:hypothetical protein